MTDAEIDEAVKLAKQVHAYSDDYCGAAYDLATAILALAERRTAEQERADVVADIRSAVRALSVQLARAIDAGHLNVEHGEGETRTRLAEELHTVADRIEGGFHVGAAAKERKP